MDNINLENIDEKNLETEKINILKTKISNFLHILCSKKDVAGLDEFLQRQTEFVDNLKKKYPDCEKYRFYHLFVGSTPWEDCPKFDFPGEDSIEKFIESLEIKE